jgi:tripartite-type tricarboxylate transporter receptor subunit TctC
VFSLLKWLSWLLVVAAVVSWTAARSAGPVGGSGAGFFAGRTITYIVPTGPGGGYDTYARLVGRHLERHLDGVRVVVRNVPGAAQQIGVEQLYRAPADGLTIGTFTAGLLFSDLAGRDGDRFDVARMSWIGKAAAEPRVLAVGARTPFRSVDDLRRSPRPLSIATESAQSPAHLAAGIISEALDLHARLIPGFSEDEAQLAVLRGEVDAVVASPTSMRALLDEGHARVVLRLGGAASADGGVATENSLSLTPEKRALLRLVVRQGEFGRLTAGPPGIPSDRLTTLRQAYSAALSDSLLLAEASRLRLPIDPLDGERLTARVYETLQPPAHVLEFIRRPPAR